MSTRTLQSTSEGRGTYRRGRFSGLVRPIQYILDLTVIYLMAAGFFFEQMEMMNFIWFTGLAWVLSAMKTKFYEVYRNTRWFSIFGMLLRQGVMYCLIVFAFFGYYHEIDRETLEIFVYCVSTLGIIAVLKFMAFFFIKRYRTALGGNYRTMVVVGDNKKTSNLVQYLGNNPDFGYQYKKTFDTEHESFDFQELCAYIIENNIDEIFCSLAETKNKLLNDIIEFADNNLRSVKFLPDNKQIFTKKLRFDYFGVTPILSLRDVPLEDHINKAIKRGFDIVFSLLVILGLLSWLVPIVAIFIKMESKGPIFFKQSRNGLDYNEFMCYKFRSMTPNKNAHLHQATRGDHRITKVGAFLRKTSIDELPQFWNVLLGDMSVVGPRPHMVSHTHMYAARIDKFMVRHLVKPGITGLAQVNGFRGEIETDEDIKGRVKYDIFYLENWSVLLDIRVIIQTVINAVSGEDKAY